MLVSRNGGTPDLPPVAEGHDAELASLVNLRSSGSQDRSSCRQFACHGHSDPSGADGWFAVMRCVALCGGSSKPGTVLVAAGPPSGCSVSRKLGAARSGAWCRQRQCAALVGWLIRMHE